MALARPGHWSLIRLVPTSYEAYPACTSSFEPSALVKQNGTPACRHVIWRRLELFSVTIRLALLDSFQSIELVL